MFNIYPRVHFLWLLATDNIYKFSGTLQLCEESVFTVIVNPEIIVLSNSQESEKNHGLKDTRSFNSPPY